MAELFMAMFGRASNQIVQFYLAHQMILNSVVVVYGMVLAMAHHNLGKIEQTIRDRYQTSEWSDILTKLATESEATIAHWKRQQMRLPVIASPYFFTLYRVRRHNLLSVLGKKHAVGRKLLANLLTVEREARSATPSAPADQHPPEEHTK